MYAVLIMGGYVTQEEQEARLRSAAIDRALQQEDKNKIKVLVNGMWRYLNCLWDNC